MQHLSLTHSGLVAGTAEYLPPEAYRAGYVAGMKGDIYALGVILYELLAGSPPRGAWRPVAQQKRVDIRVDDVIRRALTPDPAERWKSVAEMDAAIVEIENTPPRYAGTPLVTQPIRVADCAWTILGIFVFVAALGAMMKTSLSRVAWPIDFVSPHTPRTGGFQALGWLLYLIVPLAIWQLVRLFRFRAVPLREALPSPFGMKLGSSRTTAALVLAAQLICLVAPALLLTDVWMNVCRDWLVPGDPSWRRGLVVTEWGNDKPVPPWSWPEKDKNYWLIEHAGLPGDPLGRQIDRVDFIPGVIPWAMAVSAGLLVLTLLVTGSTAVVRWWPYQRTRAVGLASVTIVVTAWILWPEPTKPPLSPEETSLHAHERWRDERIVHLLLSDDVFHARYPGPPPAWQEFPPALLAHYAAEVDFLKLGRCVRAEVATALKQEAAHARYRHHSTEFVGTDPRPAPDPASRRFENVAILLEFSDHPEAVSSGYWVHRIHTGIVIPGKGIAIEQESIAREFLYTAERRSLTPADAAQWTHDFLTALATEPAPGAPDPLELLLTPRVVQTNNGWRSHISEQRMHDRPAYIASIRREARRGGVPVLIAPPASAEPHTGARQRIAIPLRDGTTETTWIADLVFSEGHWGAMSIRF